MLAPLLASCFLQYLQLPRLLYALGFVQRKLARGEGPDFENELWLEGSMNWLDRPGVPDVAK